MLEYLKLTNVGPAPEMEMKLAPRLNIITGDNGLGKSFLLDVAWWALTRRWPEDVNGRMTSGYAARPRDRKKTATLAFQLTSKTKTVSYESTYVPRDEAWTGKAGRPWNPGLVIYAHSDGGFSVWDPARNYWKKKGNVDIQDRLPAYVFTPAEVWNGLRMEVESQSMVVCNGLLLDWSSWIRERGRDAAAMENALRLLAPSDDESSILQPGSITRMSVNDARDIPTLQTKYAGAVPILHASSGIRRITALAYIMTWSWREHQIAAEQLGEEVSNQVIMLFDEVESHLHPRWQRVILSALRDLVGVLHNQARVQLVIATHSPMVLASAEPWFDDKKDALFHLSLQDDLVSLKEVSWAKDGDVVNWLVSDTFGLSQGRSIEAERAINAANAFMRGETDLPQGLRTQQEIHEELLRVLAGHDDFWPRWVVWAEQQEAKG
jgi:hypothetical protein